MLTMSQIRGGRAASMLRWLSFAGWALILGGSSAHAAPILYGTAGQGGNDPLLILDPQTGAVVQTVGPTGFSLTGLAMDPTTDILYGVTSQGDPAAQRLLVAIDTTTGAGTLVGSLGVNARVSDIEFSSTGVLYGIGSTGLGTINLTTGLFTAIGGGYSGGGIAIDSNDDIFYSAFANSLSRLDPSTGNITSTVATGLSSTIRVAALAYDPNSDAIFGVDRPLSGSDFFTVSPTGSIIGSTQALDAIAFSTVSVPEPSTLLLIAIGVISASARRRMRRTQ